MNISDKEAKELLEMEKHYLGDMKYYYPANINIPLYSKDEKIEFYIDASANSIKLSKVKYQNRVYNNIVLVRIDIDGPPHRNPDGTIICGSHIHYYKEGYGDRWAEPLPPGIINGSDDIEKLINFMDFCNVKTKPNIQRGASAYEKRD